MLSLEEKRSPRLLRRKPGDPNIGSHLPPPPGAAPPLSTSPQPPLESIEVSPQRDNGGRQSMAGNFGNMMGGGRLGGGNGMGGEGGMGGGGPGGNGFAMVPYDPNHNNNNNALNGAMVPLGAPTHLLNFQDAVAHMHLMGDGMYTS
ncbi:Hypothetical protein, putative, partial [Bodo saltans]